MSELNGRLPGGLRVLIAEDEAIITMLLEGMLEELGAKIVGPVKSIDEALRAIDENLLEAATLNVNLRGERVYSVAAELHRRSIPFVFVSGYSQLSDCPAEIRHAPHLKKTIPAGRARRRSRSSDSLVRGEVINCACRHSGEAERKRSVLPT